MRVVVVSERADQPVVATDIDGGHGFLAQVCPLVGVRPGELDVVTWGRGVRAWVNDGGYGHAGINVRATQVRNRLALEVGMDPTRYRVALYGTVVLMGPVVGEDESAAPSWLVDLIDGMYAEAAR